MACFRKSTLQLKNQKYNLAHTTSKIGQLSRRGSEIEIQVLEANFKSHKRPLTSINQIFYIYIRIKKHRNLNLLSVQSRPRKCVAYVNFVSGIRSLKHALERRKRKCVHENGLHPRGELRGFAAEIPKSWELFLD